MEERRRVARELGYSWWSWLLAELTVAAPPTILVLAALYGTRTLVRQPVIFSSLAASSFLIYQAPRHPMNSIRVMATAQLIGWGAGMAASLVFGPGYTAGAAAMVVTIVLMIAIRVAHPPAISTTIGFALLGNHYGPALSFLIALTLIGGLALLQRVVIELVQKAEQRFDRS